jgi:uncharacterized protein (DUF2252 family)
VLEASPTRADPVELSEEQAKTRVPELVPIRYGRMLVSPFTFYRGAAMIMTDDLAGTVVGADGAGLRGCASVELRGARVARAGAGVRRQRLDETLPGPWEWDVKRLSASVLIAAEDDGFPTKDQDRIVLARDEHVVDPSPAQVGAADRRDSVGSRVHPVDVGGVHC